MLLWPTVAVLGFLVLAAVVIVLATSSTARYEFERNQVQGQRQQAALAAVTADQPAPAGAAVQPASDHPRPPVGAVAQEQRVEQGTVVGLATHPAGRHLVERGAEPAWWLVDDWGAEPGGRVVAGPFPDRIEADWAALSGGSAAERAVYGVPRADGGVVRRQLPEERAWLTELGDQLDRLGEEWDDLLSDDDAIGTLVVEVAAALVEAGVPVHDCVGGGPAGGVCLTPEPGRRGVLVSWHQHDRSSRDLVRGAEATSAVQQTMNAAIAECLGAFGFEVVPFGATGCSLVLATQSWW
jgi:hypothetical protein